MLYSTLHNICSSHYAEKNAYIWITKDSIDAKIYFESVFGIRWLSIIWIRIVPTSSSEEQEQIWPLATAAVTVYIYNYYN